MADQNLSHEPQKPQENEAGQAPTTPISQEPNASQASGATHPTQSFGTDDDFLTTRFEPDQMPSDSAQSGQNAGEATGQNDQGQQNGQNGSGQDPHSPYGQGGQSGQAGQYGQSAPDPQYGQNSYGSNGYGYGYGQQNGEQNGQQNSGYGQNPYGAYGQNSGYGQNSYGQNSYGQNSYGSNGFNGNNGTNGTGWSGTGWNNAGYPNGFGKNGKAKAAKKPMSQTARTWWTAIVAALVAALLVLGIGWAGIASGWITIPSSSSLSSINSSGSGSGSAKVPTGKSVDWQSLNKRVAASVVSIQAQVSNGVAAGSGAIVDTNGDVVTNNHVVEGASQIQVTLSNGNIYSASLVGQDSTTDLAVIRIKNAPKNLTPVTFADSSKLAVGEQIMSIGNPLGYENTATTGIISALNRPVSVSDESTKAEIVTNAVQIDAAINPGNSGGPTFNAAGQVIGINSSIATASSGSGSSSSSSSGSIGIGFAIPSNLVQRVANDIIKNGHVDHAQLGITIRTGSAKADGATRAGAEVVSVNAGSAGAKAGLQKGDVIVGFNNDTVSGMYSLLGYVRAAAVNDTVKLTVIRGGKVVTLSCKLTQVEERSSSSSNGNKGNSNNNGNSNNGNGNNSNNGNGSGNGNDDDDDSDGSDGLTDPFGWF